MIGKINIAIDGYSSCGKSTLAKKLAKHLGYLYIDSGAMYRAVTLFSMKNGWIHKGTLNQEALIAHLEDITIGFSLPSEEKQAHVLLNGKDVESEIRSLDVAQHVSEVSTIPQVRKKLVALQKNMALNKGVVMDGRDIGTDVLPDAELKIFMFAEKEIRAERRYQELILRGDIVDLEDVVENINRRDLIDTTRVHSPLRRATDAIDLDNSNLTKEQQFNLVCSLVEERMGTLIERS